MPRRTGLCQTRTDQNPENNLLGRAKMGEILMDIMCGASSLKFYAVMSRRPIVCAERRMSGSGCSPGTILYPMLHLISLISDSMITDPMITEGLLTLLLLSLPRPITDRTDWALRATIVLLYRAKSGYNWLRRLAGIVDGPSPATA